MAGEAVKLCKLMKEYAGEVNQRGAKGKVGRKGHKRDLLH